MAAEDWPTKNPEADFAGFRLLQIFDRAVAHADIEAAAVDDQRVGGGGAEMPGARECVSRRV